MNGDSRMNRDLVVENNLVDRYLLGQLSESEAMAFEDFYASSPETMAELEQSAQMIDGFTHLARNSDITQKTVASLAEARQRKSQSGVMRMLSSPMYSAAATLVAVAAIVIVGINSQLGGPGGSGDTHTASRTASNFPLATLGATRGSEQGALIELGDAAELVLALDVVGSADRSFTAAVQNANGDLIHKFDNMVPDQFDSLRLLLDAAMIPEGDYRVIVRGETNTANTLTFAFSTQD